jgi:hypothetical protein
MFLNEEVQNKWKPILEHEDLPQTRSEPSQCSPACML